MCIASEMQQQQQQQSQDMCASLLLRQNDADPRTAMSASQTHRFSHNNDSCSNTNNISNTTKNNNNNSTTTNNTHACQISNNKTMKVHNRAMSQKFSLSLCAILCVIFATQCVETAPRIRRGLSLIHRFRVRSAPNMEDTTAKDWEAKLKAAEKTIKCANKSANLSFESVKYLTAKYNMKAFGQNESELKEQWKWYTAHFDHPYDNQEADFANFDLTDFAKIKAELYNAKEALEILSNSFANLTRNLDQNEDVDIKKFLRFSYEAINLNLNDLKQIMDKLDIQQNEKSTKIIERDGFQQFAYLHTREHIRILNIILNFYEKLLQRIKAEGSVDCTDVN